MSDIVLVAIITAIPVMAGILFGAIGKTASYIIDKTQTQTQATIDAKNAENTALKESSVLKDKRIEYLEGLLRKAGIDP